ncbi:MAG TPA: hypothetical protein VGC45_07705 [Gryllotalpicola sp.]
MSPIPALPAVVFDFDGTVCVGDEPVRAYADAVLAAASVSPERAAEVRGRLDAFLAGPSTGIGTGARTGTNTGTPDGPSYIDGYAAVAALTAELASPAEQDAAYHTARRALAEGRLAIAAPLGLAELLHSLAGRAERVLVTNAPALGIAEALTAIGLEGCFDRLITDARKPDGWSRILPQLTSEADRPAARLLSIGDIWLNDLAEPLTVGATAFLIDRFGGTRGPAHAAAPVIEELYPALQAWVDAPEAFRTAHPAAMPAALAASAAAPTPAGAPARAD